MIRADALPPTGLWPWLVGYALVAIWLDGSTIHRLQSCDTLIFVLASLYEWTPFFWEQDRVGLLLPLLTSFIENPFWNMLVQSGMMIFAGLSLPLLLGWWIAPRSATPIVVTLGNALFLALAPSDLHENLLLVCCYPLALDLALIGLIVLDTVPSAAKWTGLRITGAIVFLILAHWVYTAVFLYLLPLALTRYLLQVGSMRVLLRDLRSRIVVIGVALALALVRIVVSFAREADPLLPTTPSTGLPPLDWPQSWAQFWVKLAELPGFTEWALALGLFSLLGLIISWRSSRSDLVRLGLAALPMIVAGLAEVTVLSTRAWPAMNDHHPRYLIAVTTGLSVALLVGNGWIAILEQLSTQRPGLVWLTGIVVLLGSATYRYGFPSVSEVRDELSSRHGELTETVLAMPCDGIGGHPVNVWPHVFHANWTAYERGLDRRVMGVTCREHSRSSPWQHRWKGSDRSWIIVTVHDQEPLARERAERLGLLPRVPSQQVGRAWVLDLQPAP